ncbi:transcription factor bHLH95-like, partial [Carex rostrata]
MAGDGIRVINTTNKTDSCKGKKRALTSQTQDGIVSSMVRISKEKEVKTSGTGNSDHEEHIQTERDRRKRMRDLFSCLQAFHSHLPPKIDKATIVEETVNYIKNLECTLETLQKQKLDRIQSAFLVNQNPSSAASSSSFISSEHPISREAFLADQVGKVPSPLDMAVPLPPPAQHCYSIQTWTSPNVVLSIVGINAYISVCTPKKPGLI